VLPGGTIVMTFNGTPVGDHATDDQPDPFCFSDLAAGNYVVGASAPSGYGLTTPDQLRVQAYAGAQVELAFGAAQGVETVVLPPADESGIVTTENTAQPDTRSSSPLTRNIGLLVFAAAGVVLVVGMGITVFMRRR
jgi:hypothetical protein